LNHYEFFTFVSGGKLWQTWHSKAYIMRHLRPRSLKVVIYF